MKIDSKYKAVNLRSEGSSLLLPSVRYNADKRMTEQLAGFSQNDKKPLVLLHVCCAPCSSSVLERLGKTCDLIIDFYNPNIFPPEEYDKRYEELLRLVAALPDNGVVRVLAPNYNHDEFLKTAKGLEHEPERGARCTECFYLRLRHAAARAKAEGADFVTTTLTISPMKEAALLNAVGAAAAKAEGVAWLYSDFKKQNGYKESTRLSEVYGLYRQRYCGCEFSYRDAMIRDSRMKEEE